MEIILENIDNDGSFNPRASIRKLVINIDCQKETISENGGKLMPGEPYLDFYQDVDEVYIDMFSDYVFYMTP